MVNNSKEVVKAKIIHYLSVMPRDELPGGGVSARDLVEGFEGCDDKRETYLMLCEMEFDRVLIRVGKYNDTFCLSEAIDIGFRG